MAGLVWITATEYWSVSSWLFDWALETLARDVSDPELAAHMADITENHLGMLDVSALPPEQADDLATTATNLLIQRAHERLPTDMASRELVIEAVAELVTLLGNAHPSEDRDATANRPEN
jgi:hypothetical protein